MLRILAQKKPRGRRAARAQEAPHLAVRFPALMLDAEPSRVLEELGSSMQGLSPEIALERLQQWGPNTVLRERPPRWWNHLYDAFNNAFILLLLSLAGIAALTGDTDASIIISTMVVISVALRFVQEHRSSQAAQKLKEMVETTATVTRGGVKREVPVDELVPGDIVHLSAGDMIPADLRLIASKDLFVSQAALTGESVPVEKFAEGGPPASGSLLDHARLCFMGTNVVKIGRASGRERV